MPLASLNTRVCALWRGRINHHNAGGETHFQTDTQFSLRTYDVVRISLTAIRMWHSAICFAFKILLKKAIHNEGEADAGATQPGYPPPSIISSSFK